MPRNWHFTPLDIGNVNNLSREMGCSQLLARVLIARGYNVKESAETFLRARLTDLHEPSMLPGCSEAADRIITAIKQERPITIYGDYDVDGVTSTSILWGCLKLAGAKVDYYIPCRQEEGYGLNSDALDAIAELPGNNRLVVTVDCGITSVEHAVHAKSLGLELIITDHHTMEETLPDADCLVHPRLPQSEYPFGDLCGAGVALKVAWAICQQLGDGKKASPKMRDFLTGAVSLAAMGTIADVVPLVGENRTLVRFGLAALPDHPSPGLQAMLKVTGKNNLAELGTEDVSFALAPRINAAGRLNQARLAVELLTTSDVERAMQLAKYLDQLNTQRQSVERKILKEAKEQVHNNPQFLEDAGLVLGSADWHPGVIGIVANRIAEHFEKPTILLAGGQNGYWQGSGRSFAEIDLYTAVNLCRDQLITFGGHHAAIGMKIDPDNLVTFRASFSEAIAKNNTSLDKNVELKIDAEVNVGELTLHAIKELDRLGPFGKDNDRPAFVVSRAELAEAPKKMGNGDRHLSIQIYQDQRYIKGVAFGRADWADEMSESNGPFEFCVAPMINRFRGRENVEVKLIDWKVSS